MHKVSYKHNSKPYPLRYQVIILQFAIGMLSRLHRANIRPFLLLLFLVLSMAFEFPCIGYSYLCCAKKERKAAVCVSEPFALIELVIIRFILRIFHILLTF